MTRLLFVLFRNGTNRSASNPAAAICSLRAIRDLSCAVGLLFKLCVVLSWPSRLLGSESVLRFVRVIVLDCMARKPATRRLVIHAISSRARFTGHSEQAPRRNYALVNDHLVSRVSVDVAEIDLRASWLASCRSSD